MKKIPFLCAILLISCSDPEEMASTNLRKGDEFMKRGEFEIAQYYYDKIPEGHLLQKHVQKRLQEIEKITNDPVEREKLSNTKKVEDVTIVRHTFQIKMGRLPLHKLVLTNNTSRKIRMIDIDFIYLDQSGKEIKTINHPMFADIDAGMTKEFNDVSPGMVQEQIFQVKVLIKNTMSF